MKIDILDKFRLGTNNTSMDSYRDFGDFFGITISYITRNLVALSYSYEKSYIPYGCDFDRNYDLVDFINKF